MCAVKKQGSPILGRFSKDFMMWLPYFRGGTSAAWTDVRRGAAFRAGFIHVPTV